MEQRVPVNSGEEGKRIDNMGENRVEMSKAEVEQYFVGLMEGHGSVQVNHWKGSRYQYRMVIKTRSTEENLRMLEMIAKAIGGRAKIVREKRKEGGEAERAVWVTDNKTHIEGILKIFEKYPPVTTKMEMDIRFMKKCIGGMEMERYMKEKPKRQEGQGELAEERNKQKYQEPEYFNR